MPHTFSTKNFFKELASAIGEKPCSMVFHGSEIDYQDDQNALNITVSNAMMARKAAQYQDAIAATAEQLIGTHASINFCIKDTVSKAIPSPRATVSNQKPAAADKQNLKHLRHSLDSFFVGPSNDMAYQAAKHMIDSPLKQLSHQLLLHGTYGVGKTHLLQGLVKALKLKHPSANIVYYTSEQFTNAFIQATRENRLGAFRKSIRETDVIAIDDVQFLANKIKTQIEFINTIDAIDTAGTRLVMATDAPPDQLKNINEALMSRLCRSMSIKIELPCLETRRNIIKGVLTHQHIHATDEAIDALAHAQSRSIRELEGMLHQTIALATMRKSATQLHRQIDTACVRQILNTQAKRPRNRPPSMQEIMRTVCDQTGITSEQLLGKARHKSIVCARGICTFIAREHTAFSYPEIARFLQRSNHSSVLTSYKRIKNQLKDPAPIAHISDSNLTIESLIQNIKNDLQLI